MELNIEPSAINAYMADVILKSALGDAMKAAVDREIKRISTTWDNPIDAVVRSHVADIVREVLEKVHGESIRERVKVALAAKLTDDFIGKVCDAAADKYR